MSDHVRPVGFQKVVTARRNLLMALAELEELQLHVAPFSESFTGRSMQEHNACVSTTIEYAQNAIKVLTRVDATTGRS